MSNSDDDKTSQPDTEEDPPSLTTSLHFMEEVEQENDPDLENKYEVLVGEVMEEVIYQDSPLEPELTEAVKKFGNKDTSSMEPTALEFGTTMISAPGSNPQPYSDSKSLADRIDKKELSPDDIFNEIRVARAGQQVEFLPTANLHSYIISKTFSSENVVVLLNLRRQKDGEWMLDRTIAQGLESGTEGGVVSIDQYGFSEQAISISRPASNTVLKQATCPPPQIDSELTDILRRIEAYIASVDKKVDDLHNAPPAHCIIEPVVQQVYEAQVTTNQPTCENPNHVHFEDMSFLDKFLKLMNALAPDDNDPCNICNENTTKAISGDTEPPSKEECCEFAEATSNVIIENPQSILGMIESQKSMLIAQSKALLEQVQSTKSALIEKLSNTFVSVSSSKAATTEEEKDDEVPIELVGSEDAFLPLQKSKDGANISLMDDASEPPPSEYEIDIEPQEELDKVLKELDED